MPADDWFGANDRIEQATLTRLQRTYAAAARDAIKKQKSFLKKVADVESGKIKPPQYYIDTDQVDKWRQGYLTEALRQQKVIDGIMADLDKAGEMAAKTIDDANADIYSATHKKQAESLQTEAIDKLGIDPDFTVYNKQQIGILIKDQQSPFSKLAYQNLGQNTAIRRKLQMSLSTAIILGESQEKILKRIQEITGQTYKQAKRVAQTERTRVQSQATHQVAEEAREMGIRTYKQWSCQMIPPTKKSKGSRDSHRELHKRCEYTQDYFHTIWGNDLMYPGDSSAPAKEVCNCHCAYIEHVLGRDEAIQDGKVVKIAVATQVQEQTEEVWIERFAQLKENYGVYFSAEEAIQAGSIIDKEIQRRLSDIEPLKKEIEQAKNAIKEARIKRKEIDQKYESKFPGDLSKALSEKYASKEYKDIVDAENAAWSRKFELERQIKKRQREETWAVIHEASPSGNYDSKEWRTFCSNERKTKEVDVLVDGLNVYPKTFIQRTLESGHKIGLTMKKGIRSYADGYNIMTNGQDDVVVHELAHVFEKIPQVKQSEADFYQRRTEGEPLEKLRDLTGQKQYADYEVTRKDHFIHPYFGKEYGGSYYELASMGVQTLYDDPGKFRADDEEMYLWTIGTLTMLR